MNHVKLSGGEFFWGGWESSAKFEISFSRGPSIFLLNHVKPLGGCIWFS